MNKDQDFADEQSDIISEEFFIEKNNPGEKEGWQETAAAEKEPDVPDGKAKIKKRPSQAFEEFIVQLENEQPAENKIRLGLDFMRAALSQSGAPRFRDFWEGRRICLPLFKEALNPKSRATLWGEYIELSGEARRLKEILDEQSAFAIEQIELAIKALECDLEQYDTLLSEIHEISFPEQCISLKDKRSSYNQLQRELHLLNTLASRVNALRKEVLKTEMRIRTKNKLFEKLSICGDRIFPGRKELIKQISNEFLGDIENFIQNYFQKEEPQGPPLYALREEIKALQAFAKSLTLNTHSFSETRMKLSECWDKLKDRERERKKEMAVKKQAFRQNYDAALEKIKAFEEQCKAGLVAQEATRLYNEIFDYMKTIDLGQGEVRSLKDELYKARRHVFDRERVLEEERSKKERELELQRREKINQLKQKLQELLQKIEQEADEQILAKRDELWNEYEGISISKAEKQIIERLFKQIKDQLSEKKEKSLIALSEADMQSLEQLKELLSERKERRLEIKNQLESYRKALGGSGFDFEKAMMYREMIETEKASLDKINASIEEIEDKIDEIEG